MGFDVATLSLHSSSSNHQLWYIQQSTSHHFEPLFLTCKMGTQGGDFSAIWQMAYPEDTHSITLAVLEEISTFKAEVANTKRELEIREIG